MKKHRARSSRDRYREFVEHYRHRRLEESADADRRPMASPMPADSRPPQGPRFLPRGKQREYLREYLRWLWPHRFAVASVFALALVAAGLQMIEPLFMRFIIDRILLNEALDPPSRLAWLHNTGAAFLGVILLFNLFGAFKDYRQKLLNARVMLSLRRSLFDRLLHLPLPTLWDMKTGGILSRLTGDIETTTGLLQMAIVSPAISMIRLVIAVGILVALNWRLAVMAMAIVPGAMVLSFVFARRVRPIYRSV